MTNSLAYGFHTLRSTWNERVTAIGIERINDLIVQSTAEHNRQLNGLLSRVAIPDERINTSPTIRWRLPATRQLQPVDELGVAIPRREAGYYQVGFPLHRGEDAIAQSYEQQQIITVGELNDEMLAVQRADALWNINLMMTSVLYDQQWTFDDDHYGSITVKPLANGDSDKYVIMGSDGLDTDNHYLAQASAIDDANDPFPTIFNEIEEHPNNSRGPYVAFVPSNLVAGIEALAEFTPLYRTTATEFGDNISQVLASANGVQSFGDRVIGEHTAGIIIVRWRRMPSNYIMTFDFGSGADPVLRYREHEAASLRGLVNINAVTNGGNVLMNRFRRLRGFGVANRVGAVAYRIGNASYAAPSGYDAIPT